MTVVDPNGVAIGSELSPQSHASPIQQGQHRQLLGLVQLEKRADVAQRDYKRVPGCNRKGVVHSDSHGVAVDDPCQR
jgi:hypothetical protein